MDKSSKIKERILQIADFKGIAKEKFFESISMTYGNFKGKFFILLKQKKQTKKFKKHLKHNFIYLFL